MSLQIKCRIVSWDEIYDSCKKIAELVENSNYEPEILIGLARSGLVPSRLLSDSLGITDLFCLKVEHWLDTTAQHKEEAIIPYKIPLNVKGKKVLVIDDIVDTGKSMDISINYIKSLEPKEVKSAVIHYITLSQHIPNYYIQRIEEWTWLIYPWNLTEDLSNLIVKLLKSYQNLTLTDIRIGLKEKFGIEIELERIKDLTEILKRRNRIVKEDSQFKVL